MIDQRISTEQRTSTGRRIAPNGVAVLARLATATAVGIAFGVFTLWLQGRLDGNWEVLSNSGAAWTVVALVLAATCGTSPATSVAAGTLALVAEVGGFYWCAAPWQGIAVTESEQVLWTAAALVIGPAAGWAGFAIGRGAATQRVIASLAVSGLLIGEGWYLLRQLSSYRTAAHVEIVIGATVGVLALVLSRAALHQRAAAVVIGALVAGAVVTVYTVPTLVL